MQKKRKDANATNASCCFSTGALWNGTAPKFDTRRAAALPEIRSFVPRQHAHSSVVAPRARAPHAPAARSRGRRHPSSSTHSGPDPQTNPGTPNPEKRTRKSDQKPTQEAGSGPG